MSADEEMAREAELATEDACCRTLSVLALLVSNVSQRYNLCRAQRIQNNSRRTRNVAILLMTSQALSDPHQLRLHIVDVQDANMRPDCPIEEKVERMPRLVGCGHEGVDSKVGTCFVPRNGVGKDSLISWQDRIMVYPESR